jgi:hypothetical protein
MSLIVHVLCIDMMMRWIYYMLRELYLSTYSGSSHHVEHNGENKI